MDVRLIGDCIDCLMTARCQFDVMEGYGFNY